ncbi:ARM repeat-containing protein [Venustampulla echinocandica]|uniref:ARM repeat-containing protein n=1 Tax=Venustampulla echinocandica TaxID=2656787 RepID=A0A370TI94_9HELO|nr:ARM repeat-containing protein [Venustampulla echinocandica]RDL35074.1 ARM repeat-containing protein [Venustampulla echinocandica]
MAGVDLGQLPTSLEEVVHLIVQLYQPGAPEVIAKTQETLQKLQRSPDGWRIAYSLANHEDQQVRFFAALTFIVKLNTDAKSLGEEDEKVLLHTLISWMIRCVQNSEGPLVMRKLCSTLVAYFFQFSASWIKCVKHLMYCLCIKEAIPYEALPDTLDTQALVSDIPNATAMAIFWFASSLVEEVGKTDSNSMKQHKFHQSVLPNVDDIVPLISKYISNTAPVTADIKVRQEALTCFQAWVSYSHRAFIDDAIMLEPLRILTKPAIMCLADDNLYEIAMEMFADVLSNYSKFFSEDDFQLLYSLFNSPWTEGRYQRLVGGDFDFDSLQFGHFLLAFGDATLQELATNTEPRFQQVLVVLGGLLAAEGYPIHEDKIFVPALEFWNSFVENMIDDVFSVGGNHPHWFEPAKMHVIQAIESCMRKLQFPSPQVFSSWDSVDRTGFKDARRDFGDLLQQFYLVTGITILDTFIDRAHDAIRSRDWADLEVSLFCIGVFPDNIADEESRDKFLSKIFTGPVISLFVDPNQEIPARTVQSFLSLIHGYADYFQQNTEFLPNVLNIVFGAMANPALRPKASYTVLRLCSDCRNLLLPELGAFLQQYQSLTLNASLDKDDKEQIMQGICSLIQAIPEEQDKVAPLEQLLNFVDRDIEDSFRILSSQPSLEVALKDMKDDKTSSSPTSTALELGHGALRCLAGIGHALQAPNDQPVDLEEKETGSDFWIAGGGAPVQRRIFSMVTRVYDTLGSHGDIVDAACYVWRQGFRELEPGPFVMAPSMIAEFLLKAGPQTPRLGCVIGTACSFVTSHKSGDGINQIIDALLNWISRLLQAQEKPSNDPEVAQNGIDFLTRLLPKYLDALMNHDSPSLEYLLMFTLNALTGSDPLPKIAAADFWSTFINLPSQPDQLQAPIENVIKLVGPLLARALIYNIGGHAARSELDKLSEPLKKLVVRQIDSKRWFEAALLGEDFPSDKVSTQDRTIFLEKITNIRERDNPQIRGSLSRTEGLSES